MKRTSIKRKTPLKRSAAPARKTPLKRKRATPRTTKSAPSCATRGCKTPHTPVRVSLEERYCEKHATKRADDLVRVYIRARDPRCVACGRDDRGVQWAHIQTRGMRFIRWDGWNAVGLCDRCHFAYTKRPAAWQKFVELNWPGRYVALLHREMWGDYLGASVDKAAVILSYRAGEEWHWDDPPASWLADTGLT